MFYLNLPFILTLKIRHAFKKKKVYPMLNIRLIVLKAFCVVRMEINNDATVIITP